MSAVLVEAVYACTGRRYLQLVQDLLWRYRGEVAALALELSAASYDLARLEDELHRPELPRPLGILREHDRLVERIETLERDLHDAREAARGAEEELRGIEKALLD